MFGLLKGYGERKERERLESMCDRVSTASTSDLMDWYEKTDLHIELGTSTKEERTLYHKVIRELENRGIETDYPPIS